MLCRTPRCSIMFVFGTCAPTTQRSPKSRRCARITLFPTPTLIATSSTAASSRYCSPHATSTSANYPPRRARAGSIRDSFIRMALAWSYRRSIRLRPTACRSCSSKTPRPKSSLLGSGSHGQRSTTARALRIRCLCTPPARSSIILPATRTSIRHTRAREVFRLALFW